MISEQFRHNDPDAYHDREITLHDCTADRISLEDGMLRFSLPDGFWITPHHKENSYGKTIRTGAASVVFNVNDSEDITCRVFTDAVRFGIRRTRVEEWPIGRLMSLVNSEKATIEFITLYRSYFEEMWHLVIHSNQKPYYRDCELYLPESKAVFCWNDLRPEREW